MKDIGKKILDLSRGTALAAGIGIATSKVINSLLRVSQKDPKTVRKYCLIFGGTTGLLSMAGFWLYRRKKNEDSKEYEKQCRADAEKYARERMADADLYAVKMMADERMLRAKAEVGAYRKSRSEDGIEDYLPEDDDYDAPEGKVTWIEKFKSEFTMPSLPPFLAKIISGVPAGYEEAMILHLLSMLGAMCFSKVRAVYLDEVVHAANLQVVVEGNWGTGKAKFEQLFKVLFERIISLSKNKIDLLGDPEYGGGTLIVQTTGVGTSMAKYVDILAENQGCHMYIFNSEVRALANDLKKGNGLNYDFLRKAFENGDVCRNNKAKDSKNGIFPIFLNYTFTGTPKDINYTFKKELEGGTLSRIAWTCIPEAGRYPGVLRLPKGAELESIRDQIEDWTDTYCYESIPGEGDEAVNELTIDLDYVRQALKDWNERQCDLSEEENNPARKDVRLRMATIAFHCAIVIHMLYDNPAPARLQERKLVVDLTLYIADYCMERFLHKFGKQQNEQRRENQQAEYINNDYSSPKAEPKEKITDVAELKRLHDMKNEKGQNKYGWDTLAKMSGWSSSDVRRKIKAYEASHTGQQ